MHDIIVIGAGSGGLNIAGFMNKAGFKTLLVSKTDEDIGGDCLNTGCVPSKALIHASRLIKASKEASEFGIRVKGKADLSKVMDYVKSRQDIFRKHENAAYFRKIGMDVAIGPAQFTGPNTIKVDGKEYKGKKIVLATGSRPRMLDLPGLDLAKPLTNETIFSLRKLPKSFSIVGGGPIGIELGQAFQRLGSKVTVIQNGPNFLPKEKPEISSILYKKLVKEGMQFHFDSTPVEFEKDSMIVENKKGVRKRIKFDALLIAAGRVLNLEGLDLEKACIDTDGGKLIIDKNLRTTNKDVYACGDIVGSYQFTHAAELHAGVIISNLFSPFKKSISYDKLSWVTYTDPEIATFGIPEAELKRREIKYERIEQEFKEDDRAIVDDDREGKLILLIRKGKILGGSMVAPNAGELIQELILAQSSGLTMTDLFNKIYPYPTATRINRRAASKYYSRKLTEFSKRILKLLY